MSTIAPIEPGWHAALSSSAAALRQMASYALPTELDRRVLDLSERKDSLTDDERAELMAWVAFTQQRSAARLEAEIALRRLVAVCPELADPA